MNFIQRENILGLFIYLLMNLILCWTSDIQTHYSSSLTHMLPVIITGPNTWIFSFTYSIDLFFNLLLTSKETHMNKKTQNKSLAIPNTYQENHFRQVLYLLLELTLVCKYRCLNIMFHINPTFIIEPCLAFFYYISYFLIMHWPILHHPNQDKNLDYYSHWCPCS